jgi:hypothetical protein
MSLGQALLAQHDFRVIVLSDQMPRSTVQRLGFSPAETIEQAMIMAHKDFPTARVHVVPSGGVILPVLPESPERMDGS